MTEPGEDEKPTFKDMFRKNRSVLLAVLMTPDVGMVVSIFLVIWKLPGKICSSFPSSSSF